MEADRGISSIHDLTEIRIIFLAVNGMQKIKVLLFATLREYVGVNTLEMEVPIGTTVGELKAAMVKNYPRLARVQQTMMAAIDRVYASDEQVLPQDSEIAFFPPVSGG